MDWEEIFREVEFEHMCEDVKRADETLLQSEIEWVAQEVIDNYDITIALIDQIEYQISELPPRGLTVGQLIEELQKHPSGAHVIVSEDDGITSIVKVLPYTGNGPVNFVLAEL